jgi:hypothetical protein
LASEISTFVGPVIPVAVGDGGLAVGATDGKLDGVAGGFGVGVGVGFGVGVELALGGPPSGLALVSLSCGPCR